MSAFGFFEFFEFFGEFFCISLNLGEGYLMTLTFETSTRALLRNYLPTQTLKPTKKSFQTTLFSSLKIEHFRKVIT